jgi:hypothetical protein
MDKLATTDGESPVPARVVNVKFIVEHASMTGGNVPVAVGAVK